MAEEIDSINCADLAKSSS